MSSVHRRILIVDDDAGIRTSLARILRAIGHEVRVAKNGLEAIDISTDFAPDLMLVDLRMPGIDGFTTVQQIRQQNPSLGAIFMTAYAGSVTDEERAEPSELLVQSKPLDIDSLLSAIDSAATANPIRKSG